MILIAIIDKLVPSFENPHELKKVEEIKDKNGEVAKRSKLYRMGIMSAFAIAIHNFPEGLATFIAALQDLSLGIPIAIAIAIHNIPEGIAISVPYLLCNGQQAQSL
jgi:zinc transporter, ZIP family